MKMCIGCGCDITGSAFGVGIRNKPLCEPCADRMVACKHPEGEQYREYDSDGCGYTVWECKSCGYEEIDG